ncbi:MAG: transposase [Bdellovibrionaceae bacterium]|nr:transposase [Pseudobdellovibrionaceae bacterium]MBX3033306.1 transposase [Pseudobdellovibrionaceae bacterium]
MPLVWETFCSELSRAIEKQKLVVHSFVLMSNHFHLIASTPEANISQCMQQFMFRTSRRLTLAGNRINETFAGRHYKCILQHPNYYLNAYKYNYRNPVSAGLCTRVEDYPYSTLSGKLKHSPLLIPVVEDFTLMAHPPSTIEWLNTAPSPEKLEGVRFGLKHQYFKSKKDRVTKKLLIRDGDIL